MKDSNLALALDSIVENPSLTRSINEMFDSITQKKKKHRRHSV